MNVRRQTKSLERADAEMAVAHAPPSCVETDASSVTSGVLTSPFALDGWLEFNRVRWGVQPLKVRLSEGSSDVPAAHAVYYLNRRGQVWKPPTSVYLPVAFESTPTQSRARLDRQWLTVGGLLAEDMKSRGAAGRIALPPEIDDVRPWQWAGFGATVRYTFYLDLPYSESLLDPAARKQIAKSARVGFSHERVTDLTDVFRCIADTERRQGFRYGITQRDLELARDLVGEDVLRAYVCYAPAGEPASARVVLHRRGGRAIDWLVGSSDDHLRTGATQFLLSKVLPDLHAHGAAGFDFEGANLPGVSASKSIWGGRLLPFYVIEAPNVLGLARHARDYWRFWQARREERRT